MTPEMYGTDLNEEQRTNLGELLKGAKKIEDYSSGNHQLVLYELDNELLIVERDMTSVGEKFIFGKALRDKFSERGLIPEGLDIDTHKTLEVGYR